MRPRTSNALAIGLFGLSMASLAVGWWFAFLNHDANPVTSPFGPNLTPQLGLAPIGLLVAVRKRDNPIGWLILVSSLCGGANAALGEFALHGLLTGPTTAPVQWAAWFAGWNMTIVFPAGTFMFLMLLFPTGHLVSPRWRIVAWAGVVMTAVLVAAFILPVGPISVAPSARSVSNPVGLPWFTAVFAWVWLAWPLALLLLLVAVASVFVRYRRAQGDERQQIKWFAFAAGVTLTAYATAVPFSFSSSYNSPIMNVVLLVGIGILIPAACALAILKYRLYGIDVVISRTLVYGALAVLITGVYVGLAVGVGHLVGSGGRPNLGLSILATAIVAVSFQPARARLQRTANRVVYGRRATPYEVLSEFSGRVAETYAAEDVLPRMARVLQEGTGAASAVVWVRDGDRLSPAAAHPDAPDAIAAVSLEGHGAPAIVGADRVAAVTHRGELLGALSISKRRGEPITPIEQKLLDDLANQAGLVLRNVRLTADLVRHLEELRASRQRLVSAQDEERRRLERNLHDGAQQHLVALKVKLGLAEMLLQRDAERARSTLQQLTEDADEALQTLRDLARGIYPPVLADRGLVAALQSQAQKASLPVTVVASGVQRHPQAQESAVYFCVLEALQNVQKYAEASCAVVRIHEADRVLGFEVEDDGRGFDPQTVARGAGLTNLADRLDALGGTFELDSRPGAGCRVRGSLPVSGPQPAEATPAAATVAEAGGSLLRPVPA